MEHVEDLNIIHKLVLLGLNGNLELIKMESCNHRIVDAKVEQRAKVTSDMILVLVIGNASARQLSIGIHPWVAGDFVMRHDTYQYCPSPIVAQGLMLS